MKKVNSMFLFVLLFYLCLPKINAQEGFSIEFNMGPAVGDSREFFSYAFQGNFYYLWGVSNTICLGVNTGAMVFLGDGKNGGGAIGVFGSIPDVYVPLAAASKIKLSEKVFIGLDIGYALNANGFGDSGRDGFIEDESGGLYFRPLLGYRLKEKFSVLVSFASVSEKDALTNENYTSSTISIGFNFKF